MKKRALKFYDKLVMALMGLFPFFSSCDEPRELYGTPTADYQIMGTVSDEVTTLPIEDIRVILRDSRDSLYRMADTVYTDSDGKYNFAFRTVQDSAIIYDLKAEDIDGEANGGQFATKEASAVMANATWAYFKNGSVSSSRATIVKDINLNK